jgi:hypothetical protein
MEREEFLKLVKELRSKLKTITIAERVDCIIDSIENFGETDLENQVAMFVEDYQDCLLMEFDIDIALEIQDYLDKIGHPICNERRIEEYGYNYFCYCREDGYDHLLEKIDFEGFKFNELLKQLFYEEVATCITFYRKTKGKFDIIDDYYVIELFLDSIDKYFNIYE